MTHDEHIDKLLRQLTPEKAPEGFSNTVMNQIAALPVPESIHQDIKPDRYFLFLSLIAIIIALIFTIDMSFVTTWISMGGSLINQLLQPNDQILTNMIHTVQKIPSLALIVVMGIAALLLGERLISRKISQNRLLF